MQLLRTIASRRAAILAAFALPVIAAASLSRAATAPAQNAKAQQVTASLNKFLHKKLSSPNGSLRIVVKPGARADAGYFSEVAIYGKPAMLKNRMPVTELQMRATNVHISPSMILRQHKRDLVTIASTTALRIVISEDDLTQMFANGKSSANMHLKAKFLGDRLRVAGNMKLGWLNGPVVATGKMRVGADHMVYIDLLTLQLNGVEAPAALKANFSNRLNPLISANDLPFRPIFKPLKFYGPRVIITAG